MIINTDTIFTMIQPALVQRAINAALNSEWTTAIELNEKILELTPNDLDSLNRLARAYLEVGDLSKSRKIYKEVLNIDPYNVIAMKNLKRFQLIKGNNTDTNVKQRQRTNGNILTNFIEEPGKTKVVQLVRPAEPQTLFLLHCGECVELVSKQRGTQVQAGDTYVGRLPDDLGHHLHSLINSGNKYEAYIKQIAHNEVFIFIREVYRSDGNLLRPSFSVSSDNYINPVVPVINDSDINDAVDTHDDENEEEH